MTNVYQVKALSETFAEMHTKWRWFVVLGMIFIALGALAITNLLLATIVTIEYVGVLILVAGVVQIIHSFGIKTWSGFFLWVLSGVLYAAAGVATFVNPLLATFVFTLLLGMLITTSGLSRFWLGMMARHEHGWGWIVVSGVGTTVAGFILLLGWPVNSLWLLGLVLSIDLIFQGYAVLAFGLRLKEEV